MKEKLLVFTEITIYMICAFVISSCTRDEFFGIDEDDLGITMSEMYKIAKSKEFFEYEEACFKFLSKLGNMDTTKMNLSKTIDGIPFYYMIDEISFKMVLDKRELLNIAFDDFKDATDADLYQIRLIALSKNNNYKKLIYENNSNLIKRTKGSNDETLAEVWFQRKINNGFEYDPVEGCWKYGDYYEAEPGSSFSSGYYSWSFNLFAQAMEAIDSSKNKSMSTGNEAGGWIWSDYSAVTLYDEGASPTRMAWPGGAMNPAPTNDYHFHPSGNLIPSEEDWQTWFKHPDRCHYIFNYEGGTYAVYIPDLFM